MKQEDITPEIIAKAREIAEKWRMEIYEGCWLVDNIGPLLVDECIMNNIKGDNLENDKDGFPIPSISDCLEKFKEMRWIAYHIYWGIFVKQFVVEIQHYPPTGKMPLITKEHKHLNENLHLALLTALCEVLKESQ